MRLVAWGTDSLADVFLAHPSSHFFQMVLKQRAYGVTVYEMRGEDEILVCPEVSLWNSSGFTPPPVLSLFSQR